MAILKQAQQPHTPTALPSGCIHRRKANADAYKHDADSRSCYAHNNNNKKNVIDYRFPKKYDESAIRKQQCLNGTQTLHIFIYKKRMWHSHSVYIPPIAYRQNYIVLRTHHHIGCKYSQDLIITF